MVRKKNFPMLIIMLLSAGTIACQSVKPYQRIYLNDNEMKLGQRPSARSERNVETYREGASGGGSGKASGGCGCN